jgi:hypothetical protein
MFGISSFPFPFLTSQALQQSIYFCTAGYPHHTKSPDLKMIEINGNSYKFILLFR